MLTISISGKPLRRRSRNIGRITFDELIRKRGRASFLQPATCVVKHGLKCVRICPQHVGLRKPEAAQLFLRRQHQRNHFHTVEAHQAMQALRTRAQRAQQCQPVARADADAHQHTKFAEPARAIFFRRHADFKRNTGVPAGVQHGGRFHARGHAILPGAAKISLRAHRQLAEVGRFTDFVRPDAVFVHQAPVVGNCFIGVRDQTAQFGRSKFFQPFARPGFPMKQPGKLQALGDHVRSISQSTDFTLPLGSWSSISTGSTATRMRSPSTALMWATSSAGRSSQPRAHTTRRRNVSMSS